MTPFNPTRIKEGEEHVFRGEGGRVFSRIIKGISRDTERLGCYRIQNEDDLLDFDGNRDLLGDIILNTAGEGFEEYGEHRRRCRYLGPASCDVLQKTAP